MWTSVNLYKRVSELESIVQELRKDHTRLMTKNAELLGDVEKLQRKISIQIWINQNPASFKEEDEIKNLVIVSKKVVPIKLMKRYSTAILGAICVVGGVPFNRPLSLLDDYEWRYNVRNTKLQRNEIKTESELLKISKGE